MAPRDESSSGVNDSGTTPPSTGDGATNRAANWAALRVSNEHRKYHILSL